MVGPGITAAGTSVAMGNTETNGGSARIVPPTTRARQRARSVSFADVAKEAADRSPKKGADGKLGNSVRQLLEEVASKLAAVAAGRDSHQPVEVQANDLDFKAGKAKLAKQKAALRAMPEDDEDFANEKNVITAKIAETKQAWPRTSLLVRSQKTRLTRAQQRAKEAAEALEMAQRVVEESDVEIARIECELHDLEARTR